MFDEEKQQFEEIDKNEPKRGLFRTVFSRGKVEIQPFSEPNTRTNIKFDKLKKLLLIVIICCLTLTVLLIVKQLIFKDNVVSLSNDTQNSESTDSSLISNQLIRNITTEAEEVKDEKAELLEQNAQTSTTTITSTTSTTTPSTTTAIITTEGTTTTSTTTTTTTTTSAPKILDHLLASVVINRATVPNKDGFYKSDLSDAYVRAYVDNQYIGETPVKKNTLSPQWNYQIAHGMVIKPDAVLQFELYDSDKYTSHEFIGKFLVKTSDLISDGSNGKQVYRYHGSGRLWFTVTWEEVYRN